MSINNRIALAAALVLGSSSFALAQGFDPNLGNRIPLLNEPGVYGYPGGGGSGTTWLLPPAPTSSIESAPVGLYQGSNGMRSAQVGLARRPIAAADAGYGGPYREDAIRLGMARLYGHSATTYQSAPVGLYGGSYGMQSAQVGLAQRPYAAARMYRRSYGGLQTAPVGLYQGEGVLQTSPVSLYDQAYGTPFEVNRYDRASSPYAGGGF
jgi:hypothetical protein